MLRTGEKRRGRDDDSGGDKRQQRSNVRASHLLVKHRDSRRPSSWKEANITRSKVQHSSSLQLQQWCLFLRAAAGEAPRLAATVLLEEGQHLVQQAVVHFEGVLLLRRQRVADATTSTGACTLGGCSDNLRDFMCSPCARAANSV